MEQRDIEIGVALFEATGISSFEAQDPTLSNKLDEVASFFLNHPDPIFTIRKVSQTSGSQQQGLDHLLGYVKLSKEKMAAQNTLKQLDDQLSYYG